MSWRVELPRRILRRIERLPKEEGDCILLTLKRLQENPSLVHVKPLEGREDWSLRVGRWRVLLRVDHKAKVFVVTGFGPRGDIYKH
ncbi:MAG TPA: type II toxin-antitoxin system RelE/ParE family toxin [Firmicutes bacterium]|nr:type II toxin-antitoxin system RelE/ParE family toxin [Bacillota bacterium]